MKILQPGDKSLLDRIKKFECAECKCVFLADYREYEYSGMQYNIQYWKCKCPTCGAMVWREE